jgi:hypothetical protein
VIACNSEKKPEETATSKETTPTKRLPIRTLPVFFFFRNGRSQKSEIILNLWKDWDNGNLTPSKDDR